MSYQVACRHAQGATKNDMNADKRKCKNHVDLDANTEGRRSIEKRIRVAGQLVQRQRECRGISPLSHISQRPHSQLDPTTITTTTTTTKLRSKTSIAPAKQPSPVPEEKKKRRRERRERRNKGKQIEKCQPTPPLRQPASQRRHQPQNTPSFRSQPRRSCS